MAKDPAFLFYSQDFYIGTVDLTDEEVGKFIRILCVMHQKGRLKEETIRLLVGSVSVNLKDKFRIDENGLWYNERLELESDKRKNFTNSRKNNGSKGGRPKKVEPNENHMVNHMEDVNENENENINEDLNVFKNENEKKKIEETVPVVLHELQSKILSDYPHVSGMKLQLTFQQAEKLSAEFPPNVISEILDAMENKSDLRKKYTSVNLTIRNWIKIRSNTHGNINGPTLYQRPPAKGEHDPEKWRRLIAEAYS